MTVRVAEVRRMFATLDASGLFTAPAGELSIVIMDAPAMGNLHDQFMADPTPTDVITFDGDPLLGSAGEICVCADVAADYARGQRVDPSDELTLYLAHGYLHLCGYDDTSAPKRKAMRAAERRALTALRQAESMPRFVFKRTRRPSR